jgi:hypothetical protein
MVSHETITLAGGECSHGERRGRRSLCLSRIFHATVWLLLFVGQTGLAQSLPDPDMKIRQQVKPPDPYRAPGLPDPTQGATISLRQPGTSVDLPDPGVARAMAERVVSGVDGLTDTVQKNHSMIRQLSSRISHCNAQIHQLTQEMKEVLEDYRQGFFCNECGRSKREFGSDHAFYAHIAENAANGRRAIPASPEKIAAKEQEYLNKIAAFERERQSASRAISEKRAENQEAWPQIQEGLNLWRAATAFEENLIYAREEAVKRQEAAAIKQAEQNIAKVEAERRQLLSQGPQDKATIDRLNAERSLWESVKRQAQEDAARRVSYYWHDMKTASENRTREYTRLSGALQRTNEYGNAIRSQLNFLPSFTLPLDKVSVSFSPEFLGAKFKFGSLVSSGIRAGSPDATSTEVTTFLELFGRVKATVGWQTSYTPDGVMSGPTFGVSINPPNDKPKVGVPKIEEKPRKELPRP